MVEGARRGGERLSQRLQCSAAPSGSVRREVLARELLRPDEQRPQLRGARRRKPRARIRCRRGIAEPGRHAVGHDRAVHASPPATSPASRRRPPSAPRSENTFQSAATRRSEEVTGAWPPPGRSTMKSRTRWSSARRPVAIVVQRIGDRSGGVARSTPVRPRALSRAKRRQLAARDQRGRSRASRRRRSRRARSGAAVRAAAPLEPAGRRATQQEPRARPRISPGHSRRVTPGFPAAAAVHSARARSAASPSAARGVPPIHVPPASGASVLPTKSGMPAGSSGSSVRGCSTFAPARASAVASP